MSFLVGMARFTSKIHDLSINRLRAYIRSMQEEFGNIVHVHTRLQEALQAYEKRMYRQFIIGGASVYEEALQLRTEDGKPVVDRILLTRILSPAFDCCNVSFPEIVGTRSLPSWKRTSHQELNDWLGFEVTEGALEENGIVYEFQMWTRVSPAAVLDD